MRVTRAPGKTGRDIKDLGVQLPPGTIRFVIALIQRVSRAAVTVDARTTGEIGRGILALIGIERGDGAAQSERLLEKVLTDAWLCRAPKSLAATFSEKPTN